MTKEQVMKYVEGTATFGLLLVAVALVMPIVNNLTDPSSLVWYKWIYAAGALIFTVARVIGAMDKSDSKRVRRLHRIEFWAGVAFIIGAAFWFYQEHHLAVLGPHAGALAVLQPVITFSLAGAVIQIVAAWMIGRTAKKEAEKSGDKE